MSKSTVERRPVEYTVEQALSLLDEKSSEYDLARIVDPIECRVIGLSPDGSVHVRERCYGLWGAEHKCANCSSSQACHAGCHRHKVERFDGKVFQIDSEPVSMLLPDGGRYDAVVELVRIEEGSSREGNDREAENIDHAASRYRAAHDDLTRVLSADAFYELSRDAMVKNPGGRWTMVSSNIQNFKLVNTLFGHRKGNEVLVETADVLKGAAIAAGGICGRVGPDQFAMLVKRAGFDEGALVEAGRVLAERFNCGMFTFVIHFGIYHVADPSSPVSVMCGRANSALATIKDDARRSVAYFDEGLLERTLYEQAVIGGFSSALDEGRFQMYLQPLVSGNGTVCGAEALVRWIRSDGSVAMPGDFIGVLEHAGLIHELDAHIWESAVRQLAAWKGTSKGHLAISVNMSAKDLFALDVLDVLSGLVDGYGVAPSLLRVEITETALLEDPAAGERIVGKLRDKGFVVEIDDFGKGNSSLGMLKDVDADVLKIDMSLLREIESKERSRIILKAIVNMATELGMDVIAEGVETDSQLSALEAMGCSLFQGYYFARPMPVSEFEALLSIRE